MRHASPLPLFPLQSVLFPGALLSLRVFEARYLDLVGECLRHQQAFGVVCLRQGAEAGPSRLAVQLEDVGVLAQLDDVDATSPASCACAAPVASASGCWTRRRSATTACGNVGSS
jgi:Lon protease-like protein